MERKRFSRAVSAAGLVVRDNPDGGEEAQAINGDRLLILNQVTGLQVFLFPSFKLIGFRGDADLLLHGFIPNGWSLIAHGRQADG
jgi:hypothetical protein